MLNTTYVNEGHVEKVADALTALCTLIRHKPFDAPGGVVRYYGWTGPSRLRDAPRSGGLR